LLLLFSGGSIVSFGAVNEDFVNVDVRYLSAFLSEKGNLAGAYKLLGQIQEKQQQPALEAYKRSLDLDSSQNDVLLKGRALDLLYETC